MRDQKGDVVYGKFVLSNHQEGALGVKRGKKINPALKPCYITGLREGIAPKTAFLGSGAHLAV